ncbi:hypothetical protein EWM64_g5106 [Hericium alpestre]|uniref:Uncharacterized protein n=1 Tax=Hericium alpestre TaxID=135208 RepID=A0A4Y9ZWF2_9AGAM|nr:hypothetical protein EWM64_g5106 [Hericium alpestre]
MAEVSYKPQVALVTGAAQGIGEAIALRLADDGISVALNDIHSSRDALQALAKRIEAKGVKAAVVTADISQEEQVKDMVDAAVQQLGRLDVMVANAGIGGEDSILKITGGDFRKVLAVNLDGVLYCYKYAALQMVKQGNGGRIIGASSVLGRKGCAHSISYTASKFAVRGITQSCAMELREHGITVNAYAPGVIETRLSQSFGGGYSALKKMMKIADTPSTPREQVANWVAYIASPQSQSINGLPFPV